MNLQIKSQGFPELITELGIQPPIAGPFWGFETTVLPIINVRAPRIEPRSGPMYSDFTTAGQLNTPAANSFLANTNAVLRPGVWALRLSWAWVNTTATPSFLYFRRYNDTFAVVLEEEIVEVIGGAAVGERLTGTGNIEVTLQQGIFGQPWALVLGAALATAGSAVAGTIRFAYLGEIPSLAGY